MKFPASLFFFIAGLTANAQVTASSSGPIAAVLQPLVNNGTMAGAVTVVATKDKVLDLETIGYADVANKKPMAADTLFWIASMSKPITATALMMLVDEGKVNVDDPVEKYLPEFKGQMYIAEHDDNHVLLKKPTHPILVCNILDHTSGLEGNTAIEKPTLDMLTLQQAVYSYAMVPLNFDPGTSYEYCNAGINTAGRIIEVVSKMPYAQFVDERILQPLGMNDTTFWPNQEQISRLAKAYSSNPAKPGLVETPLSMLHYPLDDPRRQPVPCGGYFSTAGDMTKFCQMIFNGGMANGKTYLSPSSLHLMLTKETGPSIQKDYGFGWGLGHGMFGHPGDSYGHAGAYKTDMDIDPGLGLITILMVQQRGNWPNKADVRRTFTAAADKLAPAP